MKIGLVIIGDEILSGRRKDRHFEKSIEIMVKASMAMKPLCEGALDATARPK